MRTHVMIAVPSYTGQVHIATMRSIISDVARLMSRGDYVTIVDDIGAADIYDIRARLVARFLSTEATHLMMVDNDVAWAPGGICRLVDHDLDCVAAIYPKRTLPPQYCMRFVDDKEGLVQDPNTGLIEVAGISAGFLCMGRSMLKRMVEHYRNDPVAGVYIRDDQEIVGIWDIYRTGTQKLGEDYSFCQRWRDIGGRIWIDPTIQMAHIGFHGFKMDMMEVLEAEAQKQAPEKVAA